MATLEYTVTGQKITTTKTAEFVKHTIGYYTVQFTFDSAWDGYSEKWAVFDPDFGEPWKQPLDASGQCDFPGEVMNANRLNIGVYGVADGVQYPTIWTGGQWLKDGAYSDCPISEYPEPEPILEGMVSATKEQSFTDAQKEQARENIGALGKVEGTPGNLTIIDNNLNIADSGKSLADLYDAAMISKTASGSIVTIEDGADGVPIKAMTVRIEPEQAWKLGDPDPSREAPLPIYGSDTLAAHTTRANLWGGDHIVDEMLSYIPSGSYDEENRTFVFAASASVKYLYGRGRLGFVWLPWKENTQYTFIFTIDKPKGTGLNLNCVYTDGTTVVLPGSATPGTKKTFVYTSAAGKTVAYIGKRNQVGSTILYLDECGVFEGVLTADDFEPYEGETYDIALPSEVETVYGGSLTVNEDGSGTLTKTMDIVKVGDITWTKSGDYFRSNAKNSVIKANSHAYCSMYPVDFDAPISDGHIGVGLTTVSLSYDLMVRDSSRSSMTAAEWKTAFSDMEIVYTLQTPIVYQLTAPQVSTLLGLNNLWADTGEISITYRADPTLATAEQALAIKESIAYYQTDYTAKQAYVVNDLVYVGDVLYIVTSAIAQGATMTPNTNCQETTLNTVIKSLR